MTKNRDSASRPALSKIDSIPNLNLRNIGIVARDYRHKFPNRHRDFSYSLPSILNLLDNKGCDSVLFSLFSIAPRKGYNIKRYFESLKKIKVILLEEFKDGERREANRYVVYYKTRQEWKEYSFSQIFGSLSDLRKEDITGFRRNKGQSIVETFMQNFVGEELQKRMLGNCCVFLCGETNGVKYSKYDEKIHDDYALRKAIPRNIKIILNPIHDRMTRFEMKLKRQFLSENNRWVISVWNKGKQDKNGKVRDGNGPAWTVFFNKKEIEIETINNEFGVEIGILDCKKV